MNQRTRLSLLSAACCLALILTFALASPGQQRQMNGTGVGSDIAVPYYDNGRDNPQATTSGSSSIIQENSVQASSIDDSSDHPIDQQASQQDLSAAETDSGVPSTTVEQSSNEPAVTNESESAVESREAQAEPEVDNPRDSGVQIASDSNAVKELPRTAGELPLLAFIGLVSLIGAAGARLVTVKSGR